MSEESWGRIAYEAYRDKNGRDKLPKYEKLPEQTRKAWEAAAIAVRAVLVKKAFKIRG